MITDLSRRSIEAEWLDDAAVEPHELAHVLRDLARFNGAMLGHWPVLSWLGRALRDCSTAGPLTLVDVGCGYGDLLRAIRRWSRRRHLPIRLVGLDVNRETIRIADGVTDPADDIEYRAVDIFDYRPDSPVDIVVNSLVMHHLQDAMIVDFLRWMDAQALRGWLVCDLQRHIVPYLFIGMMGRLTRLHPMVIHDGQISVARSLTRKEWENRIAEAHIPRSAVDLRWFMFRHVIARLRR